MTGGQIDGKVAVVTGGSSGLGACISRALAGHGAHVVVVARDPQRIEPTVYALRTVNPHRSALGVRADVRREQDVERMVVNVLEQFKRIDVLIACAGIGRGSTQQVRLVPAPVARLGVDEWQAIIDTNLTGVFLTNRSVLRHMLPRHEGEIVNVVSARAGVVGQPYAAAYSASKFAVRALSSALADQVAPYGVRVQSLFPDAVETPLIAGQPLARLALPGARVAELICHMLSLPRDASLTSPVVARFGTPPTTSPLAACATP